MSIEQTTPDQEVQDVQDQQDVPEVQDHESQDQSREHESQDESREHESQDQEAPAQDDVERADQQEDAGIEAAEQQTGGDTSQDDDVIKVTSWASAEQEDLVRQGEIAADFLESLLDIADLDGDLEVDVEGNRAAVAIVDSEDGPAPRRLVGPGGSVLEALQELTRLAVQAETGERSRLMLDVAGHRADRRAVLVKTAQHAISEVKDSGEQRELEPMTAFERKVIHDEVLAAGLVSESEGAEPARYVVILPSS